METGNEVLGYSRKGTRWRGQWRRVAIWSAVITGAVVILILVGPWVKGRINAMASQARCLNYAPAGKVVCLAGTFETQGDTEIWSRRIQSVSDFPLWEEAVEMGSEDAQIGGSIVFTHEMGSGIKRWVLVNVRCMANDGYYLVFRAAAFELGTFGGKPKLLKVRVVESPRFELPPGTDRPFKFFAGRAVSASEFEIEYEWDGASRKISGRLEADGETVTLTGLP